jgi:hypothetical protein
VTGYHRKHAIRILNQQSEPSEPAERRGRPRLYDEAVRQALIMLWEASDRVCGQRLKPLLDVLLPAMERHKHLNLDPTVRAKLLKMGSATMDRLLRDTRAVAKPKKPPRTVPLIRQSVPVRTFADWKQPPPGSMEMDVVCHCGGNPSGSFVRTLVLTDIATGWTECAPMVVLESTLVAETVERVRDGLPFTLRALDTDNGGEFVNDVLVRYCADRGIEMTRSRPYHKNDQAWIEQKNGAVVRRMIGDLRFEGIAAAQALARLYAALRLFVNFFQPSFKLKAKTRNGSLIAKKYHSPQTPAARLLTHDATPEPIKARLREVTGTLDPLQLLDEIRAMQNHLAMLANGEHPNTPPRRDEDLNRFLASLATAWRGGEVRPTHTKKPRPPRYWRTRPDPFESVWPDVCRRLEADPDITGKELFLQICTESPGRFANGEGSGSLRTLQRRLQQWRQEAAHRLIFGIPEVESPTAARN